MFETRKVYFTIAPCDGSIQFTHRCTLIRVFARRTCQIVLRYFKLATLSILGLSGCSDFVPSTAYFGKLSVTANGRQCQAWSAKYPHDHNFDKDSLFPADGSVSTAMNYCRDPNNEGRIWCFTTDPDVIWEYCNFLPCEFL